jgi:transcriptional regulator with XRE-family HTH domain
MNYERERLALGAEFRRLRKHAGLTGIQLADQTGISQSKISKIETGLLLPTLDDVLRFTTAVSAPPDRSNWLTEQLAFLQTEFSSWRIAHRYGIALKQINVAELEQKARLIRVFQACVIPGLLQTPAYARSVMGLSNVTNQSDLEEAVLARKRRQELLYDSTRRFEFVITESAIWSGFCARDVVSRQIEYLSSMLALPNICVGIVPLRMRIPTVPQNSFCLYDDQLATVETLTAEINVSDPRDVHEYDVLFRSVAHVSLRGDKAEAFLIDCRRIMCTKTECDGTNPD